MTLEGTPLLFLRKKKKKWNTTFGPDLKAPFGDGGRLAVVQQYVYSLVLALVGAPLAVAVVPLVAVAAQLVVAVVQVVVAAGQLVGYRCWSLFLPT